MKLLALAVSLAFAAAPVLARHAAPDAQVTVLTHARLIDGLGGVPVENADVVMVGDRVAAAGPAGSVTIPAHAKQIDLSGKTVLPGLISDHSHLGLIDGAKFDGRFATPQNIERQLRQFQAYGVTTVTSLGVNNTDIFYDLRAKAHAGELDGADIFGADRGIGIPEGAPPFSVSPQQIYRVTTADQARQAVRDMAARHTDLIKVWVDDFHGSLHVKMKPEIYLAAIDEAHKHGLRVAAHVYYLADAKQLVNDGVDILAHGVRDQPVDAAFIAAMKQHGTWYIPTLQLDDAFYRFAQHPELVNTPFVAHALQPALRAQIEDASWRAKTLADHKAISTDEQAVAMNERNLKTLYDAGVNIGFGTDSGASPLRVPGLAEHREIDLMTDAGLTPLQAIDVATHNAAQLLHLTDRGTIAPGELADLLVVNGDPSKNIHDLDRIDAVWHRGKQVSASVESFTP